MSKCRTKLKKFQREGVDQLHAWNGVALLADEMGCVDGEAIVHLNRAGRGFRLSIQELYIRFHGGGRWDDNIPTYIRALCDGELHQHRIVNVLKRGHQKVLKLVLASGKTLSLTPDHEVITSNGDWIAVQNLNAEDEILTNGKSIRGDKNPNWKGGRFVDSDGYVRVTGKQDHPRSNTSGQVYEHILVMEAHIKRFVCQSEIVHHKNNIRHDNRLENLELLIDSPEHMRLHGKAGLFKNMNGGTAGNGGEICFIPVVDVVVTTKPAGYTEVYDIVCADPHRNFVANGIIVHNCGKTIQALAYMVEAKTYPTLIVCPASLKYHWKKEAWRHYRVKTRILGSQKPCRKDLIGYECDVFIINYDVLQFWAKMLKRILKPKLVIGDEVHMIGNLQTARSRAFRDLCKGVPHIIGISGTPLTNRPWELFPILNVLQPKVFSSSFAYGHEFCEAAHEFGKWRFRGARELPKLHRILKHPVKGVMIRRLKKDVAKYLPEKVRTVIPLEIDNRGEYDRAERDIIAWLAETDVVAARRARANQRYVKLTHLKHLTATGKLKEGKAWLDNFLASSDEKILIGTMHRDVIRSFSLSYPNLSVSIHGGHTMKERQEAEDKFRNNPRIRILFGQIKAAGQGHNFPEATNVAFFEYPWTSGAVAQFIDRVHRLTSTQTINVWLLIALNTIEEMVYKIIQRKSKILDAVLDGGETEESLAIFDELQAELIKRRIP